jgi:hypothetical protein
VDNVDPSGNDDSGISGGLGISDNFSINVIASIGNLLATTIGSPVTSETGLGAFGPGDTSVDVYSHSAAGSRYQHTFLKIAVANPPAFPNIKMQKGPNGESFFTLSGEEGWGVMNHDLVSEMNYAADVGSILHNWAKDRGSVTRHNGGLVRDLLFEFGNYRGNLDYEAIPKPGSYNSNSFTHGLVNSVGGQGPDLSDENFPGMFPGWDSPVPIGAFNPEY